MRFSLQWFYLAYNTLDGSYDTYRLYTAYSKYVTTRTTNCVVSHKITLCHYPIHANVTSWGCRTSAFRQSREHNWKYLSSVLEQSDWIRICSRSRGMFLLAITRTEVQLSLFCSYQNKQKYFNLSTNQFSVFHVIYSQIILTHNNNMENVILRKGLAKYSFSHSFMVHCIFKLLATIITAYSNGRIAWYWKG